MAFKIEQPKRKEEKAFEVKSERKTQSEMFRMNNAGQEYNGWTNYTTWGVALNIDSEQGLQEEIYTQIKEGNINNGDELKDYFKQTLEDSGNYNEDYNAYKLSDAWTERELQSDVNWYEIYETYKRNIKEEEEYQKKHGRKFLINL